MVETSIKFSTWEVKIILCQNKFIQIHFSICTVGSKLSTILANNNNKVSLHYSILQIQNILDKMTFFKTMKYCLFFFPLYLYFLFEPYENSYYDNPMLETFFIRYN